MARQRMLTAIIALIFNTTFSVHGTFWRGHSSAFAQQPGTAPIAIVGERPQYAFSDEDHALLDEIQRGCFNYFWKEIGQPAALVKDCVEADVSSVAAVGFQLSSLPIGVQRGWVSREQAKQRAITVLRSLVERKDNKKFGIYLHFVNHNTAGLNPDAPQVQASTVDHALMLAGALPAATYFGGQVAELTDKIIADSNWQRYVNSDRKLISFGWRPEDPSQLDGPGAFRPWMWQWASDEERLVYFLAVGTPVIAHQVEPDAYYRLERRIMQHNDGPPFAASWNGALFTYFFSHCWINYGDYQADDPSSFGFELPRIDWLENSRRAVLTHRRRCIEAADRFRSLSKNSWGLSPCNGYRDDGRPTYYVPAVRPNIADEENWCGGTVAPYAAASAIMFAPAESIEALREFKRIATGSEEIGWDDPQAGGYGLPDSFNLDQRRANHNALGIDAGPMLLAIENARTQLIWRLFHQHPVAQQAVSKLRLAPRQP